MFMMKIIDRSLIKISVTSMIFLVLFSGIGAAAGPMVTPITPQGTVILNDYILSLNVSASDLSVVDSVTVNISNVNDSLTTAILTPSGDYWINNSIIVDTRNTGTLSMQVNATNDTGMSNTSVSLTVSKETFTHYVDGGSIQAAINAANFSDTINVASGTYQENIVVNATGLILIGTGMPVVDAMNLSDAINVIADGVTINGFNATNATNSNDCGFLISSNNNTLIGNTANYNDYGICLDSSSNNTLTSNTADSNEWYGIDLSYSSNNMLTSNTVSNSTLRGIFLFHSSNNTLTGNIANDNNGFAINLHSSSNNNTLTGNTADSNTHYGIYLSGSSNNNMLTSNTVASNTQYGIYLDSSSYNTLTSNTADSNIQYGIYLNSSSNNNTLTGNTANNNTIYGIYLNSSNDNQIYNNYFSNTNNAYDDGDNIWNTTKTTETNIIGEPWLGGNYWSDYTGADTNGDGLGDTLTPYNSSGNITNGGDYYPLVDIPTPPTPPSSSSGGANAPTPLPDNVVNNEVKGTIFNEPVDSAELVFKNGDVLMVTVDAEGTMSEIMLTVQKLAGKPADVKAPPVGGVHSYMDIGLGRITNDDIKGATIQFKVEKKWLSENGGDKGAVVLMRFHDAWEALETTFESEDGEYYYFSARTPGFSTFAIAVEGEGKVAAVDDTTASTTPDEVLGDTKPVTQTDVESDTEEEASGLPGFSIIMGVLGIVSAIFVRRK